MLVAAAGVVTGCGRARDDSPSDVSPTAAPVGEASPPADVATLDLAALSLSGLTSAPRLSWPTDPVHVTSTFGWRVDPVSGKGTRLHKGIDLRGAIGDLAMSIADGEVRFAGHDPLLGNLVIVDHGQGLLSYYGHLSALLVYEGLAVERGAAIGLVGNTGRSAAPHLHLTIKLDGEAIDPLRVLGQPLHRPVALLPEPEPAATGTGEAATGSTGSTGGA